MPITRKQPRLKGYDYSQSIVGRTQGSIVGRTQGSAPTGLSLSSVVKRVKSLTTKKYIDGIKHYGWPPFNTRLWQRSFYDHIIRNDKSLHKIREYIINNPATWPNDKLCRGGFIPVPTSIFFGLAGDFAEAALHKLQKDRPGHNNQNYRQDK